MNAGNVHRILEQAGLPVLAVGMNLPEPAEGEEALSRETTPGSWIVIRFSRPPTGEEKARAEALLGELPDFVWGWLEVSEALDARLEEAVERLPLRHPLRRSELEALMNDLRGRRPGRRVAFREAGPTPF